METLEAFVLSTFNSTLEVLMLIRAQQDLFGPQETEEEIPPSASVLEPQDPYRFLGKLGGRPYMEFQQIKIGQKLRLIGNPNDAMSALHALFQDFVRTGIRKMDKEGSRLLLMPSATGCVKGSNHLINAMKHSGGKFFYITDIKEAYASVNLDMLAALIVYIMKYDEYKIFFSLASLGDNIEDEEGELEWENTLVGNDSLYGPMCAFLQSFFGGMHGQGLAIGGPASPFLLNLYFEAFVDGRLRRICRLYGIKYTRYVDDLTFSRALPVLPEMRREIRARLLTADLYVNHRKSKVLSREMGTVFVTKLGLEEVEGESEARLVFPKKKRRRLHNLIRTYLAGWQNNPEIVSGSLAEFLYYFKEVEKPTLRDHKTFALCKDFEEAWARVRIGPVPLREESRRKKQEWRKR